MALQTWRFVSLMLTALLLSLAFAHVWQLPPRMDYSGPFWFQTLGMYREFGPGGPGPFVELGALLSVLALAFWLRGRPGFAPTGVAAFCLFASFALWWLCIYPVNVEMAHWTATSLPTDWEAFRRRWEYAHAVRAVLIAIAFAALVASLLFEISHRARRIVPRRL
jgi:hypothetical protein